MKKVLLLTVAAVLLIAAMSFAGDPILIFRWTPEASPAAWQTVTNPVLASATGSDAWQFTHLSFPNNYFEYDDKGFIALPGTPTWTQIGRVTWNLEVSQWIYVRIGYTDFDIHVDMPGMYTTDDLQVQVISNAGVYVYFASPGDLSDGTHTLPTYLAYETDQNTTPPTPWSTGPQGWLRITDLPNQSNYWTVSGIQNDMGGLDRTYYIWFGFEVDLFANKGNYSTYVDTFIMADP